LPENFCYHPPENLFTGGYIMRRKIIFVWVLGIILVAFSLVLQQEALPQQSAEQLYEAALLKKNADGDLEGAIEIFRQILARFPEERTIAAKAQLQIGICYEKLGMKEAQRAYQNVIDNYSDQVEEAKLAREKLAILLKTKAEAGEMKIRKVLEGQIVVYSSVSPDGRYYAYPDWNKGGNLGVKDFATGESRLLTKDKGGFAADARWSPEGKNLAYCWADWSDVNTVELRVAGLDGSGSRVLFKKKSVHAFPFDWAPDEKHILVYFAGEPLSSEYKSVNLALVSVEDGSVQILKTYKLTEAFQSGRLIKQGYYSPVGRFIAYTKEVKSGQSIHNDIFLFSLDEQREIPLVRHPAEEYLLGWSPDGKHVFFASNRTGTIGVWAIRVSEQGIHKDPVLIRDNMGAMIPLGVAGDSALYYGLRNDLSFIYQAELDSESGKVVDGPKKLSLPHEGYNINPCFSPEGDRLAYVSNRGVFRKFDNPVLCIHNFNSGENIEFSPNLKASNQPKWSPDGSRIHVVGCIKEWEWALYSIDPQTEKIDPVISPEKDSDVYGHCWSESGNSIFYVRVKAIAEGSTILNNRIIHRNLNTGQEKEIGTFQSVNSTHELFVISPDGEKLAFVQRDADQNKDIINVIPVSGGNPEKICILDLNKYRIMDLAWSPDGRFILFSSYDRSERKCELKRVSAEGGKPQNLGISMSGISYLSIHPDGRQIAFSSPGETRRPPEIWVMENFLPKPKDKK
jgi:Tol biopolymer transport system component